MKNYESNLKMPEAMDYIIESERIFPTIFGGISTCFVQYFHAAVTSQSREAVCRVHKKKTKQEI